MTAPAGRTAVVTGANRADGIGLALVRELRARGCAPVVGTYRDPATSDALLDLAATDADVLAAELDVTSERSVEAFSALVRGAPRPGRPAGEQRGRGRRGRLDRHGADRGARDQQLQVHGVGMLRVTRALLPLMGRGSVAVSISSSLGSIAGMGSGSTYYAPAKALQNALTKQLAATVRREGIVAFSACPGWVSTSMGGSAAPLTPEESARRLADLVLNAGPDDAGTYRSVDGEIIEW